MKIANTFLAALLATATISICAAAQEAEDDEAPAEEEEKELSADEMADLLNSRQQLKQTFTLKRTINGELVETKQKTVTLSPNDPYRPTEAGESTLQQVRAAFDSEVLTRVEAFEEAKLDFTIADIDRDGRMTADEFAQLVNSWRQNSARDAAAPNEDIVREREFQALLDAIDPEAADAEVAAAARAKFAFISGAQNAITRADYVREYLLDFDTMDANGDTLLQGEELMRFRAVIRGEAVDDPAE